MTTEYKFRLYLFVRKDDATPANKQALASIYVDNGSGQVLADELKMFDGVARFSLTGEEPATVFGVNLTAKPAMRDEFIAFVDTLTNPAYVVLANTTLPQYADGEVILVSDNLPPGAVGKVIEWRQALGYLDIEFGLKVITPPDPTAAPEAQPVIETVAPAPAIEWVEFMPDMDELVEELLVEARGSPEPVDDFPSVVELRDLSLPREVEIFEEPDGAVLEEDIRTAYEYLAELNEAEEEAPEMVAVRPRGVFSIFGREVKVYDPDFKPTAAVLRLVERVRGKA